MSVAGSVAARTEGDGGGLLPRLSFRFAWGLAAKGTENAPVAYRDKIV